VLAFGVAFHLPLQVLVIRLKQFGGLFIDIYLQFEQILSAIELIRQLRFFFNQPVLMVQQGSRICGV